VHHYWTADRVPDWVRRDRDLLLEIVETVPAAVSFADTGEWDEEYVKMLLDTNPLALEHFSHELEASLSKIIWSETPLQKYLVAMRQKEILAKKDDENSFKSLATRIPERAREDPDFVLAWIGLGERICGWMSSETLLNEEIFLAFARRHPQYSCQGALGYKRLPSASN